MPGEIQIRRESTGINEFSFLLHSIESVMIPLDCEWSVGGRPRLSVVAADEGALVRVLGGVVLDGEV